MAVPPPRRTARRFYFFLFALFLCGAVSFATVHVRAWYHYRAAQIALAHYHFAEARDHIVIPLRTWQSSWRVHLLAARVARLGNDNDEAERQLHLCQEWQPANPEVLLEWALLQASNGDLAPVEEYLWGRATQSSEQTSLIFAALVEGYVRMYRIAEAQTCLEAWLNRQPDDTQALFLQGNLWQQVQRPQMALRGYRRALELDSGRDDVRWRLAQCLLKLGLADEAVPHLEYLHRRDANNTEITVELARGRFKQGHLPEARALLDDVLAEQPDAVPALLERGRLALATDDTAGAEKWLRRAIAFNPRDPQVLQLLSNTLIQRGDPDEARLLQDRLQSIDRDFKRLAEICLRELGQRPNDVALFDELGTLLLRLGYHDAGNAWLLRARKQDPNHVPPRAALDNTKLGKGEASSKP